MVGEIISRYKVVEKLGEGGMGVVYKAEDTKLERPVALKFLPNHLLGDAEVKKRFEREAKAAAALDHANVCTVYEVDEADGKTFIAMSLIEGESLDKRIARGPLKLDEALDIAQQIAKGLEAAHERGIVHRDVKPENVMVDAKGHVTVMDFGLAQLAQASRLTRADQTMGTTAYMSPEQTQGSGTDHRTDIWALGVVLYEMVVGEQPFKGDYEKAVQYSILNEAPEPITALRSGVPMELEVAVNKALAKTPEERYQSLGELLVDLKAIGKQGGSGQSRVISTPAPAKRPERSPYLVPIAAALAVVTLALAGLAYVYLTQSEPERRVRRFSFTPDELYSLSQWNRGSISPDGRWIVYSSNKHRGSLWLRALDSEEAKMLPGTELAGNAPFWSPDSQFVGFFADRQLKKININGGPPIVLDSSDSGTFVGGSWSPDGETIIYSAESLPLLYEIPAAGGEPKLALERVLDPKGPGNVAPVHLPPAASSPAVLFCAGAPLDVNLYVWDRAKNETRVLTEGCGARYVDPGWIVYQPRNREPGLWALPFSLESLEVTGEAFPFAEGVGDVSFSNDGTMVAIDVVDFAERLVWRDRDGNRLGEVGRAADNIEHPRLSPDGRSVVATTSIGPDIALWSHEVDRPVAQRLTFEKTIPGSATWSPDGTRLVFSELRNGDRALYQLDVPGNGEPELVVSSASIDDHPDWSSDGRWIAYEVSDPGASDIWLLDLESRDDTNATQPFIATQAQESFPRISPNVDYLAYCSDESGVQEIYVKPFPEGEARWQISQDGGCQPLWSPDGKELFYLETSTLIAVEVETAGDDFRVGASRRLFSDGKLFPNYLTYDIGPDGSILMIENVQGEGEERLAPAIHITENWYEEFRDLE